MLVASHQTNQSVELQCRTPRWSPVFLVTIPACYACSVDVVSGPAPECLFFDQTGVCQPREGPRPSLTILLHFPTFIYQEVGPQPAPAQHEAGMHHVVCQSMIRGTTKTFTTRQVKVSHHAKTSNLKYPAPEVVIM